jgi:hypothetical protein
MPRLNGKPDLTRIQINERARHRAEAIKMFGMPTPPGTQPRAHQETKPWFIPIAMPKLNVERILKAIHLPIPRLFIPKLRPPRELKIGKR